MRIRPAHSADAGAIAALVRCCASVLVVDPAAAAPFWDAMGETAHAANMASGRFDYDVAEAGSEFIGFIAIRDGNHLFNLFVAPPHQGRGVGRALWHHVLRKLPTARGGATVTVNASLNALAFYRALGFGQQGAPERVNGIAFVPMRWPATEQTVPAPASSVQPLPPPVP